jgi:hypothetical protein
MRERDLRRFPDRATQEREQFETQRLASVEAYIGYQAYFHSSQAPDQQEDLAQVAREAVIKQLRAEPDCPISYLKVAAKSAILNYKTQGKSVDGKLNDSKRARAYETLSLDEPATEDGHTPQDILTETGLTRRITEERALTRIQMDEVRSKLSARENRVLTMRLAGASWREVIEEFGYSAGDAGSPTRRRIEEVIKQALTTETPVTPVSQ